MNPQQWQAIGDIFEQVVALPTQDRAAVLNRECGNDNEVRGEVDSLLASHRAAGGFLQDRLKHALATFVETSADALPSRVGAYRLVRELGRGGMGTVFLAERDDDQYHARVAIKLVRPGMDVEFILARFRRERQTLARLQHPNICRLLDGHTTDAGLPYIVMEYIDGRWLTDYAREHSLDIRARLRLFLDVCSAVDYAHRNFIVHRDLKPSNILVDRNGVPKLLDFGICKLLTADAVTANDTVTAPMTPNYASPEQLQGDAVTVLSDVYALGAVLYELLVGRCPRHFDQLTPVAIARTIESPITIPSEAADDPMTTRQLKGDLDNVLMRALDGTPERRYESAAQLADDIRHYLNDEPVRARPDTVRYRATKYVRRHRQILGAGLLVFVALTIGLGISLYEARLAAARLDQVRNLANKLVFDVHDAVRDLPGSTKARQVIIQTGLDYLNSAVPSVSGDPRAEVELAKAYRRLGDVQGDTGSANLGDPAAAFERYRSALSLLDDAMRRAPRNLEARTEAINVYDRIGTLQGDTGKLQDAAHTFKAGIDLGVPFAATGDADLVGALAGVYLGSSESKRNMGQYKEALADALECLRFSQEAATERGSDVEFVRGVATAYATIGMAQNNLAQLEDSRANYERGVAVLEQLVASDPRNVSLNRDLMLAYGHVADVLGNPGLPNLGDQPGALRMYKQAAEIGKRLFDADRADQRAAKDYGIVLSRVETAMTNTDLPAKVAVQRESISVLDDASRISPSDGTLQLYRSLINQHLGDSLTAMSDLPSALTAYRESAATSEATMQQGNFSQLILFVQSTRKAAVILARLGRRGDALALAQRALDTAQRPPAGASPSARLVPRGLSAMALTYAAVVTGRGREAGDRERALEWLGKCLDAWRASQSEPGFSAPHKAEMGEVVAALAQVQAIR
ncbi:MAG TPA: protein kinase [Vicinamibacterales bacterium]